MGKTLLTDFETYFARGESVAYTDFQLRRHVEYSWEDLVHFVERVHRGLKKVGLRPEDRVAIWSQNRLEWLVLDWALMSVAAVPVAIVPGSSPDDVCEMLNVSRCNWLIVENATQLKQWQDIQARCPLVDRVYTIDRQPGLPYFTDILVAGEGARPDLTAFFKICQSISDRQTAAIVFTSGTDGTPQPVVLSHQNIFSEVSEVFHRLGLGPKHRSLNVLPASHILGRIEFWGHFHHGYHLAIAKDLKNLRRDLTHFRPTLLLGVPALFERLRESVESFLSGTPVLKTVFDLALAVGREGVQRRLKNEPLGFQHQLGQRIILDRIKEALGGRLQFLVSGGAPCPPAVAIFFTSIGIPLLEGYGLTETCGAVSVNTLFDFQIGTVGKPFGDVKISLSEQGEILIQSHKISDSLKNQDGWLATGDLGEWVDCGHLRVTGRKKDLIKTSGAKYVSPQKIENLLRGSSLISQPVVLGDGRKYVTALFSLKPTAAQLGPNLDRQLNEFIASVNSSLGPHEAIKKFAILREEFTIEDQDLTPTYKVRRQNIMRKHRNLIESLYR